MLSHRSNLFSMIDENLDSKVPKINPKVPIWHFGNSGGSQSIMSKVSKYHVKGCMTEKDIEEYIYKKYKVMAEEDLAKQGVVKKITKAVTKIFKI